MVETVTLQIPEVLYQRLVDTARATGRSLEEITLHALEVGSPPGWDDIPEEFQVDIAALDKLDDQKNGSQAPPFQCGFCCAVSSIPCYNDTTSVGSKQCLS